MENIYAGRVAALRSLMQERGWDAVVLTGSDPHSSEYPARRWKQVEWLSGFSGEAGDLVITADHAGLWTDTRYFIAAAKALEGTGIELHKTRVEGQVLIPEWLARHFAGQEEYILAVDGLSISAEAVQDIRKASALRGAGCLCANVPDLLSVLWKDRPQIPQTPVFQVDAGQSRQSKINWLRQTVASGGADAILVSALDEIAWLLNVRAADIDYNPLCISYLLVGRDKVQWFVLKEEVEDPVSGSTLEALSAQGIEMLRYDEVEMELASFEGVLQLDPATVNYSLMSSICATTLPLPSPIALRKAVKNDVEIRGMRDCHLRDGAAMEKFLHWLQKSVEAGRKVSEWDAAVKLGQLREGVEYYRGDSFETISAFGPSGALPHYVTPHGEAPVIAEDGLYLVDSGGQYDDGTTDITRTLPLGECTELEKEDYTLVLKGHIDLAMAVFPYGTAGCQIDALAREPLWRHGRNFGHGTGHGVGSFLGVHEGPADIRQNFNATPLLPGMVLSDEPGIYREGMHGVRHENLLLVVEKGSTPFGRWLGFEPLTLCHFDTSAILPELLDAEELEWLNAYNEKVYLCLRDSLSADEQAWLRDKTAPLK